MNPQLIEVFIKTEQISKKSMKILVCVSKTPDTTAKVSFIEGDKVFNTAGVQFIMNPYDEWYALVRALELQEQQGGTVTMINVGNADNDTIIRKGLAIGADDAVRIDTIPADGMDCAFQIAEYAKDKGFDLILLGKETIDYNGSEVGSMLAEFLDLPYLSYANQLDISENKATVSCEIEGGTENLEVELPIVLSAAKGLAVQRIANMKGIMMAKSKPLNVVAPAPSMKTLEVVKYVIPVGKTSVKMVDPNNMTELVRLLHEEAKVI